MAAIVSRVSSPRSRVTVTDCRSLAHHYPREDTRAGGNDAARLDDRALPEHHVSLKFTPLPDLSARSDDRLGDGRAATHGRALEDDGALDPGPLTHRHVAAEHGIGADRRALADGGALSDKERSDRVRVGDPAAAPDRPGGRAIEQVEGPLEVALGRADVEPVPVRGIAEEAVADESRKHVALDRAGGSRRRHALEDVALEDVDARVDQVGTTCAIALGFGLRALPPIRLLQECLHRTVLPEAHQAVGRRVGHLHQGEGGARACRLVLAQLRADVDIG